ncbi:MAG TPA: hypothetical protein VI248_02685 [Kineosporiaceae bacterium]
MIHSLGAGLGLLIYGDVIRPSLVWLLASQVPRRLAEGMARIRDDSSFSGLAAVWDTLGVGFHPRATALHQIAAIMAAKGGLIRDITVGDCLQLQDVTAPLPATECRQVLWPHRRHECWPR